MFGRQADRHEPKSVIVIQPKCPIVMEPNSVIGIEPFWPIVMVRFTHFTYKKLQVTTAR